MMRSAAQRGFTLIELSLALIVIAVTATLAMGLIRSLIDGRDRLAQRAGDLGTGRLIIETIDAASLTAIAGGGRDGPGVSGAPFGALDQGVANDQPDDLITPPAFDQGPFESLSPETQDDPTSLSEEQEASGINLTLISTRTPTDAWTEADAVLAERIRLRWTVDNAQLRMGAGSIDRSSLELELISDRVQWLRIRYLGAEGWADRFDSVQDAGLPRAIEVAVWFGEPLPILAARDEPVSDSVFAGADLPDFAATDTETLVEPARPPDRYRIIPFLGGAEGGSS